MVKIKATIKIYGVNFSPEKLMHTLPIIFLEYIEKGETGSLGRYKNKETPYGSAIISPVVSSLPQFLLQKSKWLVVAAEIS